MSIRKILVIALLAMSLPAAAEFVTVSLAHEVALSNMRVPATPSSGVQFRKCDDCESIILRVTPHTQYLVNGQAVDLKEFRANVFNIRDRASKVVVIKHHLETDTVESISVHI